MKVERLADTLNSDEFQAFLQQLAAADVSVEQWNRCALGRYQDPHVEQGRRRLVQAALMIGQCSARPQPDRLREVAQSLLDELF